MGTAAYTPKPCSDYKGSKPCSDYKGSKPCSDYKGSKPCSDYKAPIFRCLFGGDLPGCAVVPKLWRPQADAPGPGFEGQPKPPNVGKIVAQKP